MLLHGEIRNPFKNQQDYISKGISLKPFNVERAQRIFISAVRLLFRYFPAIEHACLFVDGKSHYFPVSVYWAFAVLQYLFWWGFKENPQ